MAAFLLLATLGTIYLFGYHLFGGPEWEFWCGVVCFIVGCIGAGIKDYQLTKELKNLRKYHIEVSCQMKEYLEPLIYAEFDNPVLAEIYTERQIRRGYRADMEVQENGKIIVKIYKEKENNEKESNK